MKYSLMKPAPQTSLCFYAWKSNTHYERVVEFINEGRRSLLTPYRHTPHPLLGVLSPIVSMTTPSSTSSSSTLLSNHSDHTPHRACVVFPHPTLCNPYDLHLRISIFMDYILVVSECPRPPPPPPHTHTPPPSSRGLRGVTHAVIN